MRTKVIKRLESFRVRNSVAGSQRKFLLPLSFGVSSVTLLHILDHQLRYQRERTGRTGFALQVLYVDTSAAERSFVETSQVERIKEIYPDQNITVVPLANILVGDALNDLSAQFPGLAQSVSNGNSAPPPPERLEQFLLSLPSATSRADVISILKTKLIVDFAKQHGCEGIFWGDSTTKLAEKTLAETAKGRGFSVPWQVADGQSPYGIAFHYPQREVLKKELVAHAEMLDPPLTPVIAKEPPASQAPASSRNTTIDELMKQYFKSVEKDYPSIVANVVRTSNKLEARSTREGDGRCRLCNLPVTDASFGIHGWGGDQCDFESASSQDASGLCYGCTRSMHS